MLLCLRLCRTSPWFQSTPLNCVPCGTDWLKPPPLVCNNFRDLWTRQWTGVTCVKIKMYRLEEEKWVRNLTGVGSGWPETRDWTLLDQFKATEPARSAAEHWPGAGDLGWLQNIVFKLLKCQFFSDIWMIYRMCCADCRTHSFPSAQIFGGVIMISCHGESASV